jgi:phospholipid/cholesterol/gamma-HCH transport system substrate-binding protein
LDTGSDDSNEGRFARIAAVAALVVACAGVALVLLAPDEPYRVKARFQTAGQVVKGNLVQSAGRPVGEVEAVELADNGEAELTLALDDEVTPLREGTEATIRTASLSGVANRYVDLRLAPAGPPAIPHDGVIESRRTTAAVDLDQLFNLFDRPTRRGLTNVIRGSAAQYAGRGEQANAGWRYLNPSLVATTRLFAELHRDDELLERFVVASSRLVTDVADRRDDLASLIDGLATTTGAIAQERVALSRAIAELPPFMRRANSTFVNLRATLDDLDPLVEESKPVARRLRPVLAQLRGLATDGRPAIRGLADLVRRPGANNDLLELSRTTLPLRDIAIGPVQANGRTRRGAFAESTESLHEQAHHFAFQRPYAVDLAGWFDDFSHSGIYDANGSASRVATSVNAFKVIDGTLPDLELDFIEPGERAELFRQLASIGQANRCPGSVERPRDGSNPYRPSPDYNCDPSQLPVGP